MYWKKINKQGCKVWHCMLYLIIFHEQYVRTNVNFISLYIQYNTRYYINYHRMEMFAKIFHVDVFLLIIFVIVPVYCISFFIIFRKAILLKIFDDEEYEKNETFQIHLDEPSIVRRGSGNQFIAKTQTSLITILKLIHMTVSCISQN